jgi:hypothetical protein
MRIALHSPDFVRNPEKGLSLQSSLPVPLTRNQRPEKWHAGNVRRWAPCAETTSNGRFLVRLYTLTFPRKRTGFQLRLPRHQVAARWREGPLSNDHTTARPTAKATPTSSARQRRLDCWQCHSGACDPEPGFCFGRTLRHAAPPAAGGCRRAPGGGLVVLSAHVAQPR